MCTEAEDLWDMCTEGEDCVGDVYFSKLLNLWDMCATTWILSWLEDK